MLLGVATSALGMTFLSTRLSRGGVGVTGLALALLVALGIGVHNLGEGLAIGVLRDGELQLGAFLVIGFMVHNVTEGLGIAAPASGGRVTLAQLAGLALIAGAPAILGVARRIRRERRPRRCSSGSRPGPRSKWSSRSGRYVARTAPGGLRSGWAIGGYLAGIAAMWATGLLIG